MLAKLLAAEQLGLPVAKRAYPNSSGDGSWDREWYTSDAMLERIGIGALTTRANSLADEMG